MASPQPLMRSPELHLHMDGLQCPVCDQAIPDDKADQIRERIEARERDLEDGITLRLTQQFSVERLQLEASAQAARDEVRKAAVELETARTEAAQHALAAREEGHKLGQAVAQGQIQALEQANADLRTSTEQQVEALKQGNQESLESAQRQLSQAKSDAAAEVAAARAEAAKQATAAREEGTKLGQAAALERIQTLEAANTELRASTERQIESLKTTAAEVRASAQEQVEAAQRARLEAEAAANDRVAAAETAKLAAESEIGTIKESQEAVLNARLQEQREALEKDKAAALSAKDAQHFQENQNLKEDLDETRRKLEQKTAAETGEGAEVDLFEELKHRFEGDRIRRVPKGVPGADVIHEIVENGQVCGKIVYDSKKRNSWKTEYATKLCEDKIAEGADHAILSLLKFPADCRQLDVREGVILANPARIAALADMLREHIVRTHALKLSSKEREKKIGALYAYITSDRFEQLLDAIEGQTEKVLLLDAEEEKAHRKVWATRGGLLKSVQKAEGNLRADVARIIGTRDAD